MKIRLGGFVANSSSSSYVILTTQEMWDKAVKQLNETGKAVIKYEVKPKQIKFLGQNALIFAEEIRSEDFGWQASKALDDENVAAYQAVEKLDEFVSILSKDGVSYIGTCY